MLSRWCFWFTMNALMCEVRKTCECMDKKGVMVEEWKARRKEWKKKRWKKGEKGKSGFGKCPFCFCLTVSLPLPFFSASATPPHRNTRSHSLTTQHDALVHTITCKQGCVLCCLFGSGQRDTLHHPHPTPSLDITQHTPTNLTQTQLIVRATMR